MRLFHSLDQQLRALSLILALLSCSSMAWSQDAGDREDLLKSQFGFEKLRSLEWLANHYLDDDLKRAHKFARQGDQLANNLIRSGLDLDVQQSDMIMRMKETYGLVLYQRGKFVESREALKEALDFDPQVDGISATVAIVYLDKIDSLAASGAVRDNPFKSIARTLDIGAAISNSKTDVSISTELQLAKIAEKKGDTTAAIAHYRKAANLLRNSKDIEQAQLVESKIATFEQLQGFAVARNLPTPDSTQKIALPSRLAVREDTIVRSRIVNTLESEPEPIPLTPRTSYYEAYRLLQTKAEEDSLLQVVLMEQARIEMERLQQENEIADLNIATIQLEKQAEAQQKRALMMIAGGVIVGIFFILLLYLGKRKQHQRLTEAYHDLGIAKEELEAAEQRISKMLEQQVSPEIASALLDDEAERRRHRVTVMFLDIRDFTPMASEMEPDELIEFQNVIFGFMIDIINDCHGNINQFMGDGFMATFGAPKTHGNDAAHAFKAAQGILSGLEEVNGTGKIPVTKVGIGLHTGEVVTGNVGTDHRKQFSVTGETVIIAARVEQLNKRYHSQLIMTREVADHLTTEDTKDALQQSVAVKGRKEPVEILIFSESQNPGLSQVQDIGHSTTG